MTREMEIFLFIELFMFNLSAYHFSRWGLRHLKDTCKHRFIKSVKCNKDEDGDIKTNHYENTCKICGKKWLHTPMHEQRKRRRISNKRTDKNKESTKDKK